MSKLRWSTVITIARIIPKIRPILAEFVVLAEALLPESGSGRLKLEAVKKMLADIWGTLDVLRVSFEDAWPTLQAAVAAIVAIFNARGWPKPTEPEPGTTAPPASTPVQEP